ncbi:MULTISPECIES: CBS domain-containing protein [Kosmotoga]|jgi:CBS domain-containing protein|uniref:CBS domain containing membrane protein n=1 Tax=Kosmotoga olearia (strain ATCC BAA-1733 / DSM 21960 / TBF 19.5.1) TaxID=521045 RepID=C5CF18_KOSOT|nr:MULTISPECIES: CBS domain-containing protein [Kosmotoga]ACR80287.1 CBS domain containing membrane protein [Kosmotoga olearia TBF 19.5.1]MDI3523534.1 hypothetical protein [Kosmotoga sp.]MDK2953066.1 hypothetical protein [Kosmotoga sp.]OAA20223.1 hypothetical protein DU53_08770 [Kosmotoga sp. DU53]
MLVKDIFNSITLDAPIVKENAAIQDIVKALLDHPLARTVYVVDDNEKIVGMIPVLYLLKISGYEFYGIIQPGSLFAKTIEIITGKKAKDIMFDPITVTEETTLDEALRYMIENEVQEIPVIDKNGNILGDLNSLEILKALYDVK